MREATTLSIDGGNILFVLAWKLLMKRASFSHHFHFPVPDELKTWYVSELRSLLHQHSTQQRSRLRRYLQKHSNRHHSDNRGYTNHVFLVLLFKASMAGHRFTHVTHVTCLMTL